MADNNNHRNRGHTTSWVVAGAGFGLLTFNSGLAIYRASGDSASILFVSGSYLALLLLFGALREYERAAPGSPASERAAPGSPASERARRAVWPLTAVLTLAFAWKVAAAMPSAAASALVWGLAVATTFGGFLALHGPRLN